MRLKIDNFAKINRADILVDGITVIAGENNTGKSTIGKILFSLFNSMSGIDDKITEQRMKEISDTCRVNLRNYSLRYGSGKNDPMSTPFLSANRIVRKIKERMNENCVLDYFLVFEIVSNEIINVVGKKNIEKEQPQELVTDITNMLVAIMALSNEAIILEMLSRYFGNVFHEQINSLYEKNGEAKLELIIKGKIIKLKFIDHKCVSYLPELDIVHQAIYIDNPFIVDKLSGNIQLNAIEGFLKDLLTSSSANDVMDGIIESVLTKEKLEEVYKALSVVADGRIIEKADNEFYFEEEGLEQPVHFSNLSTGLKSFMLLKMLIERGALKEKDVLILDEPEIHLHPEWQVIYAQLIVLLQKKFDLSIIVTTHSPYFLDAINIFSVKYEIKDKVNYYLSEEAEDGVKMELVSNNIEMIYKKMVSPIQMLDSLRYELNN